MLKRQDFSKTFNNKENHKSRISNFYFAINFCPNNLGKIRFGITASKKVGNAVIRNKIKRFCREYFRLNKHKIVNNLNNFLLNTNLDTNLDINIVAKQESAKLVSEKAQKTFEILDNIFEKLNLHFKNKK